MLCIAQRCIDSEGKDVHVKLATPGCISPTRQYAQRNRVAAARADTLVQMCTISIARDFSS
eukprot:2029218-Prymnesium_polylepis.1